MVIRQVFGKKNESKKDSIFLAVVPRGIEPLLSRSERHVLSVTPRNPTTIITCG